MSFGATIMDELFLKSSGAQSNHCKSPCAGPGDDVPTYIKCEKHIISYRLTDSVTGTGKMFAFFFLTFVDFFFLRQKGNMFAHVLENCMELLMLAMTGFRHLTSSGTLSLHLCLSWGWLYFQTGCPQLVTRMTASSPRVTSLASWFYIYARPFPSKLPGYPLLSPCTDEETEAQRSWAKVTEQVRTEAAVGWIVSSHPQSHMVKS